MRILDGKTEHVPLDALRPHPRNPREGDIGAIHQSIQNNGFYGHVIAQKSTGHILAGNHRWQAAQQAGAKEIPVMWIDVDDDHALRILLADNRTNDLASYNDNELADLLEEIRKDTGTLAGTGYDGDDLDELLDDLGRAHDAGADEAPEAQVDRADELREKWGTEVGQLWQIGPHRLLIGDSTDPEHLAALMNGQKADAMVTDPPYAIYGSSTGVASEIADDKMVRPFFRDVLKAAKGYTKAQSHIYVCCDWRSWAAWWEEAKSARLSVKNMIVWDKGGGGMGNAYRNRHELIMFATNVGAETRSMATKKRSKQTTINDENLWPIPREREKEHNAQKPVPLVVRAIENATSQGDIVFEPFNGSGTTMVGAQSCGRVCYAMEIEPRFAAVALERMASFGLSAELTRPSFDT